MKEFFDYVNNGETFGTATDYFIKSQIMHFYFVYIHMNLETLNKF